MIPICDFRPGCNQNIKEPDNNCPQRRYRPGDYGCHIGHHYGSRVFLSGRDNDNINRITYVKINCTSGLSSNNCRTRVLLRQSHNFSLIIGIGNHRISTIYSSQNQL
jgi:hypothetical protein